MIVTRFAPSPTGYLHVGNLRTALLNYLVARKSGGTFILRLDDTDPVRSRDEFAEAIRKDLTWLGLNWDREERQSDRIPLYEDAASRLREEGRLYECFETAEELSFKRKIQQKLGKPPVYDRSALAMTDDERERFRSERPGYWRFRLDHERTNWTDLIRGGVSIDAASVSDPVLVRGDGQFLYTLSSVVDDLDMGITDVVRGSDHVTNTGVQIQVIRALNGSIPKFSHHSLITGPDGEPLSKRQGDISVRDLRERGVEPMALLSHSAFLGTSKTFRLCATLDDLGEAFELESFGSAPTKYDATDVDRLTAKHLATLPFPAVADRVRLLGVCENMAEKFWEATRENITHFKDLDYWWNVVADGAVPAIDETDRAYVEEALRLLPNPPFDDQTWSVWTGQVSQKTGRKGRSLYLPLRKALTGRARGPEMAALMPLLRFVGGRRQS